MEQVIAVKIITNARANAIVGRMADGTIKIRIKAKPISGQANQMLVNFLSEELGIRRDQIEIISGEHSRKKNIRIIGQADAIQW